MEPHREEHNQYRCYSDHDIDRILALELFRGAELNLADITKICTDSSVDEIEDYMVQHERKLQEQMKHLERLQRKTKELLEICQRIKSHLNKFSLAETEAFEIVDEIADYRSYPEYRKLKDARLENIPILQKMCIYDYSGWGRDGGSPGSYICQMYAVLYGEGLAACR